MATYRGAALVGETIASLRHQRLTDFELVVVDDASGDATPATVRDAAAGLDLNLIVAERNGGPVVARNRAVAAARGRYIAALDQDDLCHPDRFARQVALLDGSPKTVLVASAADVLLPDGRTRPSHHVAHTTPGLLRWLLGIGNPLVWSSVMLRGDAARLLQPFSRDHVRFAEDFDLYRRLLPLGEVARIDDPLLTYRCHPGGVSKRFEQQMLASTREVLRDGHAALLGEDASEAAWLIADHLMHGEPVADAARLARLGAVLTLLLDDFVARERPSDADLTLIAAETRRQWLRVVRAAVRSGTVRLIDARTVSAAFGTPASGRDLRLSSWIGRVRAARRRLRRDHTLAA